MKIRSRKKISTTNRKNYATTNTKNQNIDPVIRQLKSWHKFKTKQAKADSTIFGDKTLLRYFRKLNNTNINENTDFLE